MLYFNAKGQTLIEVIVAIAVCALILLGVTRMITSSFTNVNFSEAQVSASSYAQQGMDYIGNIHDTDYAKFRSYIGAGTYCYDEYNTPTSFTLDSTAKCVTSQIPNVGLGGGIDRAFIRSVVVQNSASCPVGGSGTQDTQVIVTVQWNQADCGALTQYCHNSRLVSCFSNANIAPTL